jgi:hypothetical protein
VNLLSEFKNFVFSRDINDRKEICIVIFKVMAVVCGVTGDKESIDFGNGESNLWDPWEIIEEYQEGQSEINDEEWELLGETSSDSGSDSGKIKLEQPIQKLSDSPILDPEKLTQISVVTSKASLDDVSDDEGTDEEVDVTRQQVFFQELLEKSHYNSSDLNKLCLMLEETPADGSSYVGEQFVLNDNEVSKKILIQQKIEEISHSISSPIMKRLLETFNETSTKGLPSFSEGVSKADSLMNVSYGDRARLFGSKFSGLFSPEAFVDIWNKTQDTFLQMGRDVALQNVVPFGWKVSSSSPYSVISEKNETPSKALDTFVQGPSLLTGDMGNQLSLLFGLRFILGNRAFDDCFRERPLVLSSNFFKLVVDNESEREIFPFADCFSIEAPGEKRSNRKRHSIGIQQLSNHPAYIKKHLAKQYSQLSLLELKKGEYSFFEPIVKKRSGLRLNAIKSYLLFRLNERLTTNDEDKVANHARYAASVSNNKRVNKILQSHRQNIGLNVPVSKRSLEELKITQTVVFDVKSFQMKVMKEMGNK